MNLFWWPRWLWANNDPVRVMKGLCTKRDGVCTPWLCRQTIRVFIALGADCPCCEMIRHWLFGAWISLPATALLFGGWGWWLIGWVLVTYFLIAWIREATKNVVLQQS